MDDLTGKDLSDRVPLCTIKIGSSTSCGSAQNLLIHGQVFDYYPMKLVYSGASAAIYEQVEAQDTDNW